MGINSKRVVAQWPKTVNLCDDYLNFYFLISWFLISILQSFFSKEAFLWLKVWLELLTCLSSNWGSEKSWICYSFFVKIFPLAGVSINHTHTGWDVTSQEVILVVFWQLSEWWWHYTHTVYTFTKNFFQKNRSHWGQQFCTLVIGTKTPAWILSLLGISLTFCHIWLFHQVTKANLISQEIFRNKLSQNTDHNQCKEGYCNNNSLNPKVAW